MTARIITGDCRDLLAAHGPYDMLLADPPYGDTSLDWDRRVAGWESVARDCLKPTGSMWVFGSMRFFLDMGGVFRAAGWRYAQDIVGMFDWPDPCEAGHVVWEKHNGSGFAADRFKRVHEFAVQLYRDDAPWAGVYNEVQTTPDATAKAVRRKKPPAQTGHIEAGHYVSHDGGPRLMRSVIEMRSCHGHAIHPTEKPVGLLQILVRTSCPPGGLVGVPFSGSGAAEEACLHAGRRSVGFEVNADMADKARRRLGSNLFGSAAA